MFSYVMVRSSDLEKSKAFYDATLGALGYDEGFYAHEAKEVVYVSKQASFVLYDAADGEPASNTNGHVIGLKTRETANVDAWHAAGIANGGTSYDELPGIRDNGKNRVYNAHLKDPDGHKLCAVVWLKMSGR